MMTSDPRRAGITLVEVMVAIAILGMVTTAIYSGFGQVATTKRELSEVLDRSHAIHGALARMARELGMAYVSFQRNPDPSLRTMQTAFRGSDGGDRDRVDFTSFSHRRLYRDAHESDQNEISYFLVNDPNRDDGSYALARRQQNRLDNEPTRGGEVFIILDRVESLDLEYLDPASNEWSREWNADPDAADAQRNRLPSQVRIKIEVTDPDDESNTITYATRAQINLTWALNHAVYTP